MKNRNVNPMVKSSVIYILATGLGEAMSFLGIIVFTRLMSKADYGNYSTYYAFVALFPILLGVNLYYSLNNAYIDKTNKIKEFRKSVLFLSTCTAIFMSVLIMTVGIFFVKNVRWYVILFSLCHSYCFFIINYTIYSANMENDYKKKLWLLILPNTMQFILSLLFILAIPSHTFIARVVGSVIGVWTIAAVCYFGIIRSQGKLFCQDDWHYALCISVPSILMSVSNHLLQQCDKIMITNIWGAEETAVYSVIYYLGYSMIAVNIAIGPVRQAWIFKKISQNNLGQAKCLQKYYLMIFMFLAAAIMLFGRIALNIIAPPAYWKYEYILPFVISACMMVLYAFYTEIVLFYKKNMILSLTILLGAIINVVLNAVFIPKLGAIAACYTTVISYFLIFLLTGIISDHYKKGVYSKKYFVIFLIWIGIIAMIDYFFHSVLIGYYGLYSILLVVIIYYTIRHREELKVVIKST